MIWSLRRTHDPEKEEAILCVKMFQEFMEGEGSEWRWLFTFLHFKKVTQAQIS